MLNINDAAKVANLVAAEFEVPPPPPIYPTNQLPSKFAAAYYHDYAGKSKYISIRPEYFTEGTVAHEVGHYIYHTRGRMPCHGDNPECEQVAQMIEKYWVAKRKREGTFLG